LANRNDDGRAKLIVGSSLVLTTISIDGRLDLPTKRFALIQFSSPLSISDPQPIPLRV
jgi:hypothetical protein